MTSASSSDDSESFPAWFLRDAELGIAPGPLLGPASEARAWFCICLWLLSLTISASSPACSWAVNISLHSSTASDTCSATSSKRPKSIKFHAKNYILDTINLPHNSLESFIKPAALQASKPYMALSKSISPFLSISCTRPQNRLKHEMYDSRTSSLTCELCTRLFARQLSPKYVFIVPL